MKEFWNQRYAGEEYAYGRDANNFFSHWIDKLPAGRLFLPGEGEGRNAVFAASKGWNVTAFDQSETAKEKALNLATENEVSIEYKTGSILDVTVEKEHYDLIALVYFHLLPEARERYHAYLMSGLKKGGVILMEVFNKDQLGNESGGPKDLDLLYDLDDIINDFKGLEVLYAAQEQVLLNEGAYHQGMAEVIRFAGKKV